MTLPAGTRLGPYEIVALLGAGGMGEVYEARDTRLDRTVALKVLPEEFFEDEERRTRFEREAKVLASLNHPGIAAIYSFEEILGSPLSSSPASSRHLLAMELVEGEDLAQRLALGPLSLEDSLSIARQIAEALESAHEKGIVHRDLKPANVKVTEEGKVKLLDFGLAKAFEREGDASKGGSGGGVTQSPTLTARATAAGVILGTVAYMSPEQARGKSLDKRTDIWSFGCVLYEMLTGKKAFVGETVSDTLAAVLTREPDWRVLPVGTPERVREILRKCLRREAKARLHDIADARLDLEELAVASSSLARAAGASATGSSPFEERAAAASPAVGRSASTTRERGSRRSLYLSWAVAGGAVALAAALTVLSRRPPPPAEPTRFKILAPPGQSLLAFSLLSPNARRILLLLRDDGGKNRLAVRSLDSLAMRILPGTEDARGAFWSSDGREIGFFAEGKLKKMSADGGPTQEVCESGGAVWGAWSPAGTILFAKDFGGPFLVVPASGGEPRPAGLDSPGEYVHQNQPWLLPDGRHFLFLAGNADFTKKEIVLGSLGSKETRPLFPSDTCAVYAEPGYLLFGRDDAVLAWRFDPGSLRLAGEPFPAFANVHWTVVDNFLSLSAAGNRVAYISWSQRRRLVWVDRKGRELGTLGEVAGYFDVRISPDGRRVAVAVRDTSHARNGDIWVLDTARGTGIRLTSEPSDDFNPAWSPDGRRLAYVSDRYGFYNLFERPADGGPEKLLLRSDEDKVFPSVLTDGRHALLSVIRAGSYDREIRSLDNQEAARRLGAGSRFSEEHPSISPNGRWCAFDSIESGQREVYIQAVPDGPRRQISLGGGQMPVWSRNGRELFYVARDGTLMSVALHPDGSRLEPGEPQPLFPLQFDLSGELPWHLLPYDVTPDGQRFLVIRRAPGVEPDGVVVVTNWVEALRGPR